MTDSSTHLYSPGLVGIIATESSISNINGKNDTLIVSVGNNLENSFQMLSQNQNITVKPSFE